MVIWRGFFQSLQFACSLSDISSVCFFSRNARRPIHLSCDNLAHVKYRSSDCCVRCCVSWVLPQQNSTFYWTFPSPILSPSDSGLGRNSRTNVTPKLKVRHLAILNAGFQAAGQTGRRDQGDYSWKRIQSDPAETAPFEPKCRQNLMGDNYRALDICSSLLVDCIHCLTIKRRADLTPIPPEEAQRRQETWYYAKRGLIVFPPGNGLACMY